MNTAPTLGWNMRVPGLPEGIYECAMSWERVVTVYGYGATRSEASGHAAALYRAALWLVVMKEANA